MIKKEFEKLNETIYSFQLENGLKVNLIPRADYHKVYGIFTTDFGSIDNHFIDPKTGEEVKLVDGVAHFLEHKLFESEDGDAFDTFSQLGAQANAFTSFTRTSYLFSTTNNVNACVNHLLDFVQKPAITEQGVEKEKGIIGQEIQMYMDVPTLRGFYGLLKNLFPDHPIHIDIAGTVESINQIDKALLDRCYHTFYHPSNMNLLVIGGFDVEEMKQVIETNQANKVFPEQKEIVKLYQDENPSHQIASQTLAMPIIKKKLFAGLRSYQKTPKGRDYYKYQILGDTVMELLFGYSSSNYETWYQTGLIDDSYVYGFDIGRSYNLLIVESDSNNPEALSAEVQKQLASWQDNDLFNEAQFEKVRKKWLGHFLQSMNSLEFVANQYGTALIEEAEFFDIIEITEEITFEEVKAFAHDYINLAHYSDFILVPNGDPNGQ